MFPRFVTAIIVGVAGIAVKTGENKEYIEAIPGKSGSGQTPIFHRCAPERIRTTNLLIRSQMLYPVELRAPVRAVICERTAGRSNTADKIPTDLSIGIDYFRQGYGVCIANNTPARIRTERNGLYSVIN
jgi:hypothetical protein